MAFADRKSSLTTAGNEINRPAIITQLRSAECWSQHSALHRLAYKGCKKKKKEASQRKRAPKPSHVKINPACVSGPLPCCSGKCFHPGQGKGDSVSSLVITARSSIQCHANPFTSSILTRGLWGKLRPREEKELARGHSGHRTEKELSCPGDRLNGGAWSL